MRIFLSKPHLSGDEMTYVKAAFDSNFVAPLGPQLDQFENEMGEYLGGDYHCLGVSSGTAALHLALRMLEIERDDEIWLSSMTFAGGVFPIIYEQGRARFFDVAPKSWTLCPDLVSEALKIAAAAGKLPKAIIGTDLYGQSCELDKLEQLGNEYGVKIIMDSAESAGASYRGRKCGTGGDMAILSFNGNKIITTGGGGMLVSKDKALIECARFLSTQARDAAPHYEHSTYGYNYRMGNVVAAIGIGQLRVLDDRVKRRRTIFEKYFEQLSDIPGIEFMPEPSWSHSNRWLTAITVDPEICGVTREQIRLHLLDLQIESRPLWKPMHMQPLFEGSEYTGPGVDERLFASGLCLPSGSDLTIDEQDEVISEILGVFKNRVL